MYSQHTSDYRGREGRDYDHSPDHLIDRPNPVRLHWTDRYDKVEICRCNDSGNHRHTSFVDNPEIEDVAMEIIQRSGRQTCTLYEWRVYVGIIEDSPYERRIGRSRQGDCVVM